MKTKAISWTLAGLIATQNVAFADTDRTQGIGDQAILSAQTHLTTMQEQMRLLDEALAKTAEDIKARDNSGGITNALSITGAGIGLGVAALSYYILGSTGGRGAGTLGTSLAMYFGVITAGVTTGSSVIGIAGQGIRPDANTTALDTQLQQVLEEVTAAQTQTTDQNAKMALAQMNLQIKSTAEALQVYQNKQNSQSRNKLMAQSTQLLGAAISAYVIINDRTPTKFALLGPLLMATGNLGNIVSGLSSEQAELILNEIQKTRESLKLAAGGLQ